MVDSDTTAERKKVEEHIEVLARLPYGPLFFDRTAALDFRLVEKGATELADELALLEEGMAGVAEKLGAAAGKLEGVGRLFQARPEIRERLAGLLGRILPVLGHPAPSELAGRVPVAVDLHLSPRQSATIGLVRRRRIEISNN